MLIYKKFESFCIPRQNKTLTWYELLTYEQKEGKSFDELMAQLKKLSSHCEYEELKNSLIKNIVVLGATNDSFRERMLTEPNLTLEKATALEEPTEETKFTQIN